MSLRVGMVLPGLGREQRGAETAFIEIGAALAAYPDLEVVLFGAGSTPPAGLPLLRFPCLPRTLFERFPTGPVFRTEYVYEELGFVLSLGLRQGLQELRRCDVVIHCTFPFVNWSLQLLRRFGGPPTVFVTENGDWMVRENRREYAWFGCDRLVAINPDHYETNRGRFPTTLIPNGVDPEVFRPDGPASCPAPLDERPVVMMASAMIPSKGVDQAVRAVALVPDVQLVVAGDGPERDTVAGLASALLPGRCHLLGAVPRDTMPALFRRADAFLHISREEPFGIVYLEAAASGLPAVVHDGPVPRWILGEQAFFADTADAAAVAAALRRALGEAGPARGAGARQRVLADWTWKQQARKYRALLYELLGRPLPAGQEG